MSINVNTKSGFRRFMNIPRPTLQKELKGEEKELGDDITNLQKKVRKSLNPSNYYTNKLS